MYTTYNLVSKIFVEPEIKFYISRKSKSVIFFPNSTIKFGNYKNYYLVKTNVHYKDQNNVYHTSHHKVPYFYAWNRDIRKKLRKFGLGFIRPVYTLPNWFVIKYYNHDVYCKSKWDDYSYELPPTYAFCIFGIVIGWYLYAPKTTLGFDDHYWEAIYHLAYNKKMTFEKLLKNNIWTQHKDGETIKYCSVRPAYIKAEYQEEYKRIIEKLMLQHNAIC